MSEYDDAMRALNAAAYAAVRAANNEDGAPVDALKRIADDVDCLIDFRCTRAEINDAKSLYDGAKRAGLIR